MIQIDDLMAYDWVLYNGNPVRVEEISRPSQKVAMTTPNLAAMGVSIEKIEPIEISALSDAVMEKNGFHVDSFEGESWWCRDIDMRVDLSHIYCSINIEFKDGKTFVDILYQDGVDVRTFKGPLKYIHQIQNALRATGLTLNIFVTMK